MKTTQQRLLLAFSALIPLTTLHSQNVQAAACQEVPVIGTICYTGANFCPRHYFEADGRLLSITEHPALHSLLKAQFGGDDKTTFALPDLRGRLAVGAGMGLTNRIPGEKFGATDFKLTNAQLPAHEHTIDLKVTGASENLSLGNPYVAVDSKQTGESGAPDGKVYLAADDASSKIFDKELNSGTNYMPVDTKINGSFHGGWVTGKTENTGNSEPVPLGQPSLTVKACISYRGTYPSRD